MDKLARDKTKDEVQNKWNKKTYMNSERNRRNLKFARLDYACINVSED